MAGAASKARSWTLRALALACATPLWAQAPSQLVPLTQKYSERLLATYYEGISTRALDTILPHDKYKLLIDVTLDDANDLRKVQEAVGTMPLPGTTGHSRDTVESALLGQLESLPQKRSILLVIDPSLQKDAEHGAKLTELLREALMGKLKLNLAGGNDAINVRTNEITQAGQTQRSPAVEKSPLLDFRDWSMGLLWLLTLGVFAVLAYLVFRKLRNPTASPTKLPPLPINVANKMSPPTKDDEADENKEKSSSKSKKGEEGNSSTPALTLPQLLVLPTSANAQELIDKFKQMAEQYPKLTVEAIQTFIDQQPDKMYRLAYLIELLGFEQALYLLKGISQRYWKYIGHYMSENPISNQEPIDLEEVAILLRVVVASVVEHKGLESDMGVFEIEGYSASDLADAISSEDNEFIAKFISGTSDAMAQDILNALPQERRVSILTLLSGVDQLDAQTIDNIERTLQTRLAGEHTRTVTVSNESRIFASLANLPAHEEEELFAQMAESDPGLLNRSRRFRLYPQHLAIIRPAILQDELRSYPIDGLAQMLKGIPPDVRELIIAGMSEKKALVVQDTLQSLDAQPNGPEFAMARRDFLDTLYRKYAGGGAAFIDNIFMTGEESAA